MAGVADHSLNVLPAMDRNDFSSILEDNKMKKLSVILLLLLNHQPLIGQALQAKAGSHISLQEKVLEEVAMKFANHLVEIKFDILEAKIKGNATDQDKVRLLENYANALESELEKIFEEDKKLKRDRISRIKKTRSVSAAPIRQVIQQPQPVLLPPPPPSPVIKRNTSSRHPKLMIQKKMTNESTTSQHNQRPDGAGASLFELQELSSLLTSQKEMMLRAGQEIDELRAELELLRRENEMLIQKKEGHGLDSRPLPIGQVHRFDSGINKSHQDKLPHDSPDPQEPGKRHAEKPSNLGGH